jgi:PKD repeat protein
MSLPSSDRVEYPVSSIGIETFPQSIVVKGTLWMLHIGYGRIIIKEYGGQTNVIDTFNLKAYKLTAALKNDLSVDSDRFWVWIIDLSDVLSLYELEPYVNAKPVITYSKLNLDTNVSNADVYVSANDSLRVITLYTTKLLKSVRYQNIRSGTLPIISDLKWTSNRLSQFNNFITSAKTNISVSYLDVASPPNVYIESYTVTPPTNLSVFQIDNTNEISTSWDASVDSDMYRLERDTNIAFTSPTSVTTTLLSYVDTVPLSGIYYYRVIGISTPLLLQSTGSNTDDVTITLSASFSGNPLSAYTGNTITFTDLSTPVGTITSWDWDFGDGSAISHLQNPTHIYALPGNFTVTLIIYSGLNSATEIKPSYVNIAPSVVADFSGTPTAAVTGQTVQFTDSSFGTPISWDWDFGDGTPHSYVQNPTHVYVVIGQFTVSLTVHDAYVTSNSTKTNYITVTPSLISDFYAFPLTSPIGYPIQFTDSSFGTPISWDWDFGDGTPHSYVQNPIYAYADYGVYSVTLITQDIYGSSSITKPDYITISPSLIADFIGSPRTGDSNLTVQFTDRSVGTPISWDWDFGDGSEHSYIQNPIHVYNQAGSFSVTLVIMDEAIQRTETKPNYINVNMVTDFIIQNASGPADLMVQFTDITLGSPTSWDWDFGDSYDPAHSYVQNPTHTYTHPGQYTVTLIASNAEKTDTEIKTNAITVYTHADFVGDPQVGYLSLSVQFVDTSTGFPTSWYWDFGDESFSNEQNPSHQYIYPGQYTVTLTSTSSFNSDAEIKVGYIVISGIATPDLAPEPDILMYLNGSVEAYHSTTGIRIGFRNRNQ